MCLTWMYLQFMCRNTAAGMWVMYIFTLCASRMYVFYETYSELRAMVSGEKYLLQRCNDPEFFSNIRQHTDLCTTVFVNARTNLVLNALNKTLQGSYLYPILYMWLLIIHLCIHVIIVHVYLLFKNRNLYLWNSILYRNGTSNRIETQLACSDMCYSVYNILTKFHRIVHEHISTSVHVIIGA